MKKWPIGEIRRAERAYSPKYQCFGYYMLGSFIKNVPDEIELIMNTCEEPIILIQRTETGIFKIVGRYFYENIPKKYQDHRGQYPSPGYQEESWKRGFGMVTGFPLRPWIRIPVPCSEEEYHDTRMREQYKQWASTKCESPIEKRFLDAAISRGMILRPQWWVYTTDGNFRLDFAVVSDKIAIEIDGHEFHSSREQRTHDAQRERILQALGWKVIRFTGSEIHANAGKCIDDLINILHSDRKTKSLFDF